MQSTQRSSKGKGRATDGDYEQSFASLSLSDGGDTPRAYASLYPDSYGSSYDPTYTVDGQYVLTDQSLLSATSSSTSYGGTPGYSNSYSTTPATNSVGGYDYRSQPLTASNYTDCAGYDTTSVSGSSVNSSYGASSMSGWSEAQSYGTVASSAPSTRSNQTDVNNTINRQRPANQRHQLPCEFRSLTNCDRVFPGDDMRGWMDHVETHLQSRFPTRLKCWFCNEHPFDAKQTSAGDTRYNFNLRMEHIRDHIVHDGARPEEMQTDGHLVEHLRKQGLIDGQAYQNILTPRTVPQIPGDRSYSSRSDHRSPRNHCSHGGLPRVEEQVAPGPSNSRHHSHHHHHHRRSEHRRDRDHNSSRRS